MTPDEKLVEEMRQLCKLCPVHVLFGGLKPVPFTTIVFDVPRTSDAPVTETQIVKGR